MKVVLVYKAKAHVALPHALLLMLVNFAAHTHTYNIHRYTHIHIHTFIHTHIHMYIHTYIHT